MQMEKERWEGRLLLGGCFQAQKHTFLRKPQILPFFISDSSVFQMILKHTLDLFKCIFFAVLI